MIHTLNNYILPSSRAVKYEELDFVMLHRITFAPRIPRSALTGQHLHDEFADTREFAAGSYTGGHVPYQFLVRTDGTIDQLLEVGNWGPHARRWSNKAIAIASAGDFRTEKPTAPQWLAARELAALFRAWIGRRGQGGLPTVIGHTEAPGATGQAGKECPGDLWNMLAFRTSVEEHELSKLDPVDAQQELLNRGVVF